MSAVAAAPAIVPEQDTQATKKEGERALQIVDLNGDGKTLATTKSFNVTWTDKETGKVLVGTFTATRPNLGQLGQVAVMKARLNGGQKVDPQTDFIHEMISDLHYTLTTFPEWWTPNEFFTADPLREVWDHVVAWLGSFRNRRVV